jgi:hypothetical protein
MIVSSRCASVAPGGVRTLVEGKGSATNVASSASETFQTTLACQCHRVAKSPAERKLELDDE